MNIGLTILASTVLLILSCYLAVKTGLARRVFFELYARVKGEDLLGPTVLHNPPDNSPYQRWLGKMRDEIPIFQGGVIHAIESAPLKPWPRLGDGVCGLYLRLAGNQMVDGLVLEIPPRGKTLSERHLYEKGIYFMSGSGYTLLEQEGLPTRRIEWQAGDLLSIPLNVRHQHCNVAEAPARMFLVTSFPLVLNLLDNEDFIANNPGTFPDRYDGTADYLDRAADIHRLEISANLVRDIRTTAIRSNDFRGKGNKSIRWLMAGNSMLSMHISELPPRMLKKSHRISSNALVLVLSGEGVTCQWREGAWKDRLRIEWKEGTVFAPPVFWYQQHLNRGKSPARYLAINVPNFVRNIGLHFEDQLEVDATEIADNWKRELAGKPAAQ